ncbi:uncharacterized protein N7503_006578 [Penicillium pulvis]|uniref:uncharacterized protein n=1 Tax=Penicillium pulvis TaxID=1562058 RepID=UPI0025466953|nr:uncharacterized protein N7503_006578 [Penicillium pulvis]KAJ5797282.1 hypothetical protein N7503_006578 [Penicillium pulvis]
MGSLQGLNNQQLPVQTDTHTNNGRQRTHPFAQPLRPAEELSCNRRMIYDKRVIILVDASTHESSIIPMTISDPSIITSTTDRQNITLTRRSSPSRKLTRVKYLFYPTRHILSPNWQGSQKGA